MVISLFSVIYYWDMHSGVRMHGAILYFNAIATRGYVHPQESITESLSDSPFHSKVMVG